IYWTWKPTRASPLSMLKHSYGCSRSLPCNRGISPADDRRGLLEQGGGDCQAQAVGGPQIDHQLQGGRRGVGIAERGIRQGLADVRDRPAPHVRRARSVAQEAAHARELAQLADRRELTAPREVGDLAQVEPVQRGG